ASQYHKLAISLDRASLNPASVADFKTHALGLRYERSWFEEIKANHRKNYFQVFQKCLHIGAVSFTQASPICRRLIAISKRNPASCVRHFDEPSFKITSMSFIDCFITCRNDNGGFPKVTVFGGGINPVPYTIRFTDISPHAQRVFRIRAVEYINTRSI